MYWSKKKKKRVLESLNLGESDGAIRIIYFVIIPKIDAEFFFLENNTRVHFLICPFSQERLDESY